MALLTNAHNEIFHLFTSLRMFHLWIADSEGHLERLQNDKLVMKELRNGVLLCHLPPAAENPQIFHG